MTLQGWALLFSLRHGEPGQWESPGGPGPVPPSSWREGPVRAQRHRQLHREGPPRHHGLPGHGRAPAFPLRGQEAPAGPACRPSLPALAHGERGRALPALPSHQPRRHVRGLQLRERLPSLLPSVLPLGGQQRELHQPLPQRRTPGPELLPAASACTLLQLQLHRSASAHAPAADCAASLRRRGRGAQSSGKPPAAEEDLGGRPSESQTGPQRAGPRRLRELLGDPPPVVD